VSRLFANHHLSFIFTHNLQHHPPSMSEATEQYLWIAVVGTICGFIYAFGIGANDVANAFGSSVSSKSLTLKQAVVVAGVFEFLGAYFLGASVTSTIRENIVDIQLYSDDPEILMLGMFTSLCTAMVMLLVATFYGLPVSTTHTIVGCIIGFSCAARGFESVSWDKTTKIFISWLASPLLAGAMGFILFGLLRYFVLSSEHAFERGYYCFSVVLFVGVFINVFYVLYK
jgi:phosphate/sulfate permease